MVSFETASWYTVRLNGDYSFQNAVNSGAISKASTRSPRNNELCQVVSNEKFREFSGIITLLGECLHKVWLDRLAGLTRDATNICPKRVKQVSRANLFHI